MGQGRSSTARGRSSYLSPPGAPRRAVPLTASTQRWREYTAIQVLPVEHSTMQHKGRAWRPRLRISARVPSDLGNSRVPDWALSAPPSEQRRSALRPCWSGPAPITCAALVLPGTLATSSVQHGRALPVWSAGCGTWTGCWRAGPAVRSSSSGLAVNSTGSRHRSAIRSSARFPCPKRNSSLLP